MAKKVLVTGGAGFIGSHVVKALVGYGHEVVVLDNLKCGNKLDKEILESVRFILGDVKDEKTVQEAAHRCDCIFHLAAVLGVDIVADNPVETMETEVVGTKNVCHAALLNGTEIVVYASTSGVYGKAAIEKAVGEEFAVSPNTSYSIAKRFNEIYLKSLYEEKQLQSVSIRYFNVYGPKQDFRMVIPKFFSQAMKNSPITVYGTGEQSRDFTYIDDVVSATIKLMDAAKGCEIVNVSRKSEISIKQLAQMILKICDSKSEISLVNAPKSRYDFEVERRIGDSNKLLSIIGEAPETRLEQGLEEIYDYILRTK